MSVDQKLKQHAQDLKGVHLRTLLSSQEHCNNNLIQDYAPQVIFDYSRQHVTQKTMGLLLELAQERHLDEKIHAMATGCHINNTEDRAVLHIALRSNPQNDVVIDGGRIPLSDDNNNNNRLCAQTLKRGAGFNVDGVNTNTLVQPVLDQIRDFSNAVRNKTFVSPIGRSFKHLVVIGIGGSYLGTQFIYDALKYYNLDDNNDAENRKTLHFVANVDPADVTRTLKDHNLNYQETLFIIVSKTFTTAETIMNAKVIKNWLLQQYQRDFVTDYTNGVLTDDIVLSKHFVACSTAIQHATAFGIDPANIFPFWDWVGGRFSVTSCVGILPLSLYFGYDKMCEFLAGCHDMDWHFLTTPMSRNLPILLGLLGVWNSQYLGYAARSIAPYSESLGAFVAHIQQVDMESNGKRVNTNGDVLPYDCGEVDFGIPGTNSQHSYFQLFHQGRVVPVDFLGFIEPQQNQILKETLPLTQHDELMCNFFAQPDALALGTPLTDTTTCANQHKYMPGNRPSNILLFKKQTFYTIGLLLALYEHRTAVQGFIWDINSFDQWGVQLGKVLATNVRNYLLTAVTEDKKEEQKEEQEEDKPKEFAGTTQQLLQYYTNKRNKA